MEPTADPEVVIESRNGDEIIYRRSDGLRWSVKGTCDRRGDCLIGSVIDGKYRIRNHRHLARLNKVIPGRIDSELDVPVGPNFTGCCPFTIEILS